ncbi:MAG: DNA polymerase ligase N-terminal domain-containing protein [Planctomycetota bacterium]|jgi:hypothetical protein
MNQKDKRFVIQKHAIGKNIHWDFMLESGGTLQTYRLEKAPEKALRQPINAIKIFDHSLKFLTYQGPVNKGRGNVVIYESGTYQIIHQEINQIELNLSSKILKGKFSLSLVKDNNWRFTKNSLFQDS